MYSLTTSLIFGLRNTDKVANTDDKGRILATVGQFTKAFDSATKLDNAIGKSAKYTVNLISNASGSHKGIEYAAKGAKWASQNVNPLLIGAAGYRVLKSDNKVKELRREICGMSAMFGGEYLIKEFFKSNTMTNFKNSISNPTLKNIVNIIEGLLFVAGSITTSTLGYKLADKYYGKIDKDKEKQQPKTLSDNLKEETAKLEKLKTSINKISDTSKKTMLA